MSGSRRRYQSRRSAQTCPAVGCPLDEAVRRLVEQNLVACHEREFAITTLRELLKRDAARTLAALLRKTTQRSSATASETRGASFANLVGSEALAGTSRRLVPAMASEQCRRCAARTAGRTKLSLHRRTAPTCEHEPQLAQRQNRTRPPGRIERSTTHPVAKLGGSPLAGGRAAGTTR